MSVIRLIYCARMGLSAGCTQTEVTSLLRDVNLCWQSCAVSLGLPCLMNLGRANFKQVPTMA